VIVPLLRVKAASREARMSAGGKAAATMCIGVGQGIASLWQAE
jgi:hypothetical protein